MSKLSRIQTLVIVVFVVAAIGRFAYSITWSPKGWSGDTYMDLVYNRQVETVGDAQLEDAGRWWGPMFFIGYSALKSLSTEPSVVDALQRAVLSAFWMGALLIMAALAVPVGGRWTLLFQGLPIAIGLQSTAAIYAISSGMGEIVTGFCVIAHCYLFERRHFQVAALTIVFGVYFKLWPILFLWPYVVFAAVSSSHRAYLRAVCIAGLVVSGVAVFSSGWWLGPMYPFSMLLATVFQSNSVVPLVSREVFGLVFFVSRLITGFNAAAVEATSPTLIRVVSVIFSLLMLGATTLAAVLFARSEPKWGRTPEGRRQGIVMFQTTIGLIYISCAMDVSVAHLLSLSVGIYATLILIALNADTLSDTIQRFWKPAVLFAIGAWLIGTLVPLSIVLRLFPLAALERWAGNMSSGMIPQEQYMWYQIPLFAMYLLGAAAWLTYRKALDSRRV